MKKFSRFLAWPVILALLGCPCALAEGDSATRMWRVGYGSCEFVPVDYDPETDSYGSTYYVAGYNNDHPATGMLDPQYVRAAYISDGSTNVVVAAVDCVGLSANSIENIRTRIAPLVKEYGLADVHIASTHTHAGIDTLGLWGPVGIDGKNDAFMEVLYDAAADAIRQACENQKEGRLFFGSAETGEEMQRDSRDPQIYDRNIYRLRFEPADGSNGLQIVSYDAHAEALRSDNSRVSADYPCYLGKRIKALTGDDFIFFAGAVGGLIMTERLRSEKGTEYVVEKNVVLTGEILADTILGCEEKELKPELSHASKTIRVDLENTAFIAMAFAGVLDTHPVKGGGSHNLALESRVSLLNFGGKEGVTVSLVPGELFPEIALGGSREDPAAPQIENPTPLKDLVDGKLIVWGLVDDEIGYIVTPNDFLVHETNPYLQNAHEEYEYRHYEETNSVGPVAATVISDAVRDLAQEIGVGQEK